MKHFIKILVVVNLVIALVVLCMIDIESAFDQSQSFVVFNKEGQLVGAKIAEDDQWRFPIIDSLPGKYEKALLHFEDKRYYSHPGVDVFSISRAIKSNAKAGKIVSGASTITMQLMRLSRNKNSRSLKQKLIETYLAVLYTVKYDKETILRYYASNAPFGGNVVGVETAAWRYFGRNVNDLSWAEAATLAVLPNSPALMHPGKNRSALKKKRDRLLNNLAADGIIDSLELNLAIVEALPQAPKNLPSMSSHLVEKCKQENPDKAKVVVDLDYFMQKNVYEIVNMHEGYNQTKGINNASVIVRDNKTGAILAYVGNTKGDKHSHFNNMASTPRSTGSILKPLLYACSMEESLLAPKQLVSDVPIQLEGFQPKNYDKDYRGLVPANEALSKSLNIPFVMMLKEYGVERFVSRLQEFGFTTIDKGADHYGLSLILGGAEITLEELTLCYSKLGKQALELPTNHQMLHPSTIYHTFEAMMELQRPNEDNFWENFSSSQRIAWKTGTSYGNRDAWAVGVCPEYTVGVWVGNSTGESRPEIIGSSLAGPLLFDVVHSLRGITEFKEPLKNLQQVVTCTRSGMLAQSACIETETSWLSPSLSQIDRCDYHQKIYLDESRSYVVTRDCVEEIIDTSWFVVQPKEALFLKRFDPTYSALPELHPECLYEQKNQYMDIVYPQEKSSFVLPKNLKNEKEKIVCEVAHQFPGSRVYWHIDDEYIGMTEEFHKISIESGIGRHTLYVIDEQGRSDKTVFEIIK